MSYPIPVRCYRRRKTTLDLDLNVPLPENAREGRSVAPDQLQHHQQPQQQQQQLVPMIHLDDIDDDVIIESSPRAFAEARRNRRRRTIVDVDLENQAMEAEIDQNRSTEACPMQPTNSSDLCINLEGSSSTVDENARQTPEPPKVPVFSCPICLASLTEEMSTRCGHIFCKKCIKTAIAAQGKCPTCRKKLTVKELRRVFLPAANFASGS